jgi:hypothetical protein
MAVRSDASPVAARDLIGHGGRTSRFLEAASHRGRGKQIHSRFRGSRLQPRSNQRADSPAIYEIRHSDCSASNGPRMPRLFKG